MNAPRMATNKEWAIRMVNAMGTKDTVEVSLPRGKVIGVREPGACRFSAIPYAAPPLGELRFRPPQPATWHGVIAAAQPGPVAPQLPSRLRGAMGDFEAPQSEDCLHLTVWTPAADRRRRPVVVWLHGGAWQSGAGALPWYDGASLAARGDIVVVAPNFRLGALGWMALPGETANLGQLDQEAALAWVREHIEAFGGDPDCVTVMGQSAGAVSVACMLIRQQPMQRGILQSASLGRGFRSLAKAHEIATVFLQAAGVETADQARQLPVQALLDAQRAIPVQQWLAAEGAQRSLFGPVADGAVLPQQPEQAMAQAATQVDVIVGYALDEMAAFPGQGRGPQAAALGDQIYGASARRWAQDAAAGGRRAWSYRFDHRASTTFGACHCIELPFVFDTVAAFDDAPMLQGLTAADAQRLTQQMQSAWIAFIREGDPRWLASPHQEIFT